MPSSRDKHTYIPPHVQQAMSQHMNQTMPAHLQKYQSGGGYVPQHVERAMTQHMEKTLPGSMKQYAGAYMEQNVVSQHTSVTPGGGAAAGVSMAFRPRANQVSYRGPQDAFQPVTGQTGPQQQAAPQYSPTQPAPSNPYPAPENPGSGYDFIMNPAAPPKQSFQLPGGNSLLSRVLLGGGALLGVIILFTIVKSIFGGGGNMTPFVTVAQDQQSIISIISGIADNQQNLSTNSKNFAATAQLSLTSSQTQTVTYLANNKKKVSPKVLALKTKASVTDQLTAAAAAGTYDSTFQEVMKSQLNQYSNDLSAAFNHTSGKKGQALLKDEYNQAQLMLNQLPGSDDDSDN